MVPICSIIGHVDVGKTKLLDLMRSSETEEASGITQQIGATLYNSAKLKELAGPLEKFVQVDGILMIDTPGHECFTATRYVGMMVSDIVIILLDVFKGLQTETKRCLDYLKKNNKTIIFAVNKIDRLYGWKKGKEFRFGAVRKMLKKQDKNALDQLDTKLNDIKIQLAIEEINAELYYKNTDADIFCHIVPISAATGEGVRDLIALISKVHSKQNNAKLNDMYGYILDEREDDKHGKYYICVHKTGTLNKGDKIMVGSNEYTIKRLLVIHDQQEIKDTHKLMFTNTINEPCGFGLIIREHTLLEPGAVYSNTSTDVSVYETDDLTPYMKDTGLTVVTPSRILMDAFVKSISNNVNINLSHVGKLDKPTIIKTSKWIDNADDEFGKFYNMRHNTILWFNPSNIKEDVDKFTKQFAKDNKVTIISGNTIYGLMDKYNKYIKLLDDQMAERYPTVFSNVTLRIIPKFIFLKKTPLMFGVTVERGRLKIGDNMRCNNRDLGKVIGLKLDGKDVTSADINTDVCVRLSNPDGYVYEQDFNSDDTLTNIVSSSDMDIRYKYSLKL